MITFIFGLVLAVLALSALTLLKTYNRIPLTELRRLARQGDETARLFMRPKAYGLTLSLLLWIIAALAMAGSLVLLVKSLPTWLAFITEAVIIIVGFAYIPSGRLTSGGIWLAKHSAGILTWLLDHLEPILGRLDRVIRRHHPIHFHTGVYEKADLAHLLEQQRGQDDNRIAEEEIDLLTHALGFGDRLVIDALIPKRVVVSVDADDAIGPALMAELHKSGHSRFPVRAGNDDETIVGILFLHDLVATKHTGTVRDIMKQRLSYVHEDFTLFQTLQAFLKTKQHLFIVINNFEEMTGIITIEDVVEQMVGQPIVDEFDTYDDLRAVAAAAAAKEHAVRQKKGAEPAEPTPEIPEMVK